MAVLKNVNLALEVLVTQVAVAGCGQGEPLCDPVYHKMMRQIKTMLNDHGDVYRYNAEMLPIEEIYDELVRCAADGEMNYGRLVAVYTLLYVYAEKYKGSTKQLKIIRNSFTRFLTKEVSPWIRRRGGMNDFLYNQYNRNVCYVAASVVIGVIAAVMIKDAVHWFISK